MKLILCINIHRHLYRVCPMSFRNLDGTFNLPYDLSSYINLVFQNFMYIEGCNSIKWKVMYVANTLCQQSQTSIKHVQ